MDVRHIDQFKSHAARLDIAPDMMIKDKSGHVAQYYRMGTVHLLQIAVR